MATDHRHHTNITDQQVDDKVEDGVVTTKKDDVTSSNEEASRPETRVSDKKGAEEEQLEPSVIDVGKKEGGPDTDVAIEEKMEVEEDKLCDVVKGESEESSNEGSQKVQEDQMKIVEIHEADNEEATEKKGDAFEVLGVEEPTVEVKRIENPGAAEKLDAIAIEVEEKVEIVFSEVEKPESGVCEVEVKPEAPSDEVKYEEIEQKEDVEGEKVKEKEILADKLEDSGSLNDEKTQKEEDPNASTTWKQIVPTNLEAEVAEKEGEEKSSLPDASEKVGSKDDRKEADEAADDAKTIRIESEKEEKSVITEESTHPVKVEDVESTSNEVTEKTFPRENADKDVEQVENKNQETPKQDGKAEGKSDEVSIAVNEPFKEPQKSEAEEKDRETEDTKAYQDLPKEAPPAKPTQKQSNNIISKVKQSLVKAKKAIIGKSPSPKTLSSETKGDIKVK